MLEAKANWLGKRTLNPVRGAFQVSTGTFDGVTRRHRGGSDGLRAGWLAGLAPIQLPSGVIRQEHPFNAAAAEFTRVVQGLWRDKPALPLFFNGVYPKMFAPTLRANKMPTDPKTP